ncbi:MAG: hydroxyphenylacetyl-CoA thioesterase PaaI [Betaproteobacteria bacterium]|jgi:acyl-CoA thioesterase|nr:hydroxyphenylacetyl-CoA thioesterase PaaI [Betaproteobacteria bacterium]NBP35733.1 hydroxyphenylacetyl-CoA thioesterase PaaI [Betaproteobacteria bacterium]NBP38021.1 hydroxyphenylacetyl-CoA thioesterase PaaI [Betaproteobacteria bacterium]NBQ79346.1 hydroxyphenylacetyl-CoA thioesterase PaaI [Betaproteobacteria bacterium]NBQ95876.1 hydroxyphenylacetyl-CoA thioesterase PaaI [Betaproteobacteria bacterium]
MTAQECAERVRDVMFAEDTAAKALGIEILSIGAGRATLRMLVQDHMTNGHHICHGGFIFTLADTAFAYSCNSYNQRCVAAGAMIDFVAAAHVRERLIAEAFEVSRGKRSGVYDVRVTREDGGLIAVFRGRSATIKGQFFESSHA